MQDNTDHIFENEAEFLDDSWAKMSAMLEEELPTGSPIPTQSSTRIYKRGAVLLLLLLIGTTGLFYLNNEKAPAPEKDIVPTTDQQIASSTQPKASNSNTNKILESEISTLPATEETENKLGDAETDLINSGNNSVINTKLTDFLVSESTNGETVKVASVQVIKEENVVADIVLTKGAVKEITILNENIDKSAQNQKVFDQLALTSINQPILAAEEEFDAKQLLKTIKPARKWTIGIMAGVQQEKINQGFGGFSGSVLLSRSLGKNFTLETGLTYSLTQFNNTELNNSPTQLNFSNENPNSQNGVEEYLTTDPYTISSDANIPDPVQLGSASWLSIPVLLTYQPDRRWRVNMGVEYSQLLQANEQKVLNNTSNKSGNITDLIAGNNISALTGITWFAQKNLAIDIRYQYGFTDLSKINPKFIEQTDTRAALQWSLVYYFNPTVQ